MIITVPIMITTTSIITFKKILIPGVGRVKHPRIEETLRFIHAVFVAEIARPR